ncbi:hypothetical protein ACFYXV_33055 [Streptomyces sp. NPDC002181]|uniref:hypothetical protein n=1 Tax=Streptomyces sp. NPDC002181 TaxID=3364635 RepID=UPI0036C7A688
MAAAGHGGCRAASTSRDRLEVEVAAPGVGLSFTANASVKAGKISLFTQDADGGDSGSRSFSRALESRLFPALPQVYVNTFYERV